MKRATAMLLAVSTMVGLGVALTPDSAEAWVRLTKLGIPVKQCDGKLRLTRNRRSIPDNSVQWQGYRNGAESWNHLPANALSVLRQPGSDAATVVAGNQVSEVARVSSSHYLFEHGLNGRTVSYAAGGCIVEADILIKVSLPFSQPTRARVKNNLWSTMTHEIGHAVGLDHSARLSIMSSGYSAGGYRTLRGDARGLWPWPNVGIVQPMPDDQNAIEEIYPASGGYNLPNLHVVGQYRDFEWISCGPGGMQCKIYTVYENFPVAGAGNTVPAGGTVQAWLMTCNNGTSVAGPYGERVRLVSTTGGVSATAYVAAGLLKDPGTCTKHKADLSVSVPPGTYNIVHEVDSGDFISEDAGHEEDDNVVVFSNYLVVQ